MPSKRPERENVMLAYPMDSGKLSRLGSYAIVQPKLNGERCRVEWFRDSPVLLSSYGNQFPFLRHITEALLDLYHQTGMKIPFDGELYKHGWPFSRIHSAASADVNYNPDNAELELHIFDYQDMSIKQENRTANLAALFSDIGLQYKGTLEMVPSHFLNTSEWEAAATAYLANGYEGIILRKPTSKYEMKRTVNMLKFKPTEYDNYLIVDVLEAFTEDLEPKGMVGAFLVADADGKQFKVGAGKLTHPERISIWNNRKEVIGGILQVKHEKLKTSGGVPVCATAVEVKNV